MEIISDCIIDRITTVYLDPDAMEQVNLITELSAFHEVNFVDYSVFEVHPELTEFVKDKSKITLLKNKTVDYILFRLDI